MMVVSSGRSFGVEKAPAGPPIAIKGVQLTERDLELLQVTHVLHRLQSYLLWTSQITSFAAEGGSSTALT